MPGITQEYHGNNWDGVHKKIVFSAKRQELFSSGKEKKCIIIMGERQTFTTPATLTKEGQSVKEAVMMSKDCGIVPQDKK